MLSAKTAFQHVVELIGWDIVQDEIGGGILTLQFRKDLP